MVTAVVLAACTGDNRANTSSVALPPGLRSAPTTNADAAPPQVPFHQDTPRQVVRAVNSWPHDSTAFTQGLLLIGARLYESTGLVGQSSIREVERTTGRVLQVVSLPAPLWGEGIAAIDNRIYQLTWQHHRGFIYRTQPLAPFDSFTYDGEGWGLTTDGAQLYMSDGTSTIRVIDPTTFQVTRTFQVREVTNLVWMLNELEWVQGELWANVFQTNFIARIDPHTGLVLGWLDLSELLSASEQESVRVRGGLANGMAFDASRMQLLVTGKLWPRLFAIDVRTIGTTTAK